MQKLNLKQIIWKVQFTMFYVYNWKKRANSYNPNSVAEPEMKLLETSIWEDGYTMPVVIFTCWGYLWNSRWIS
jgi:hypothetical protein